MSEILTLTMNPTLDRSARVPRVDPDRKLRCRQIGVEPGGGGVNVARAVGKLGGRATALWVGGGHTAGLLGDLLDGDRVDHQQIEIEGAVRENLTVFQDDGRQYRFVMPGPTLDDSEVSRCLDRVVSAAGGAEFLVASGSLPPGAGDDFYARLSQRLGGATKLVLDSTAAAMRAALGGGGVYAIKPNFRELGELAGDEISEDEQVEAFSRRLVADGKVEVVVTSLGAGGAVLVTSGTSERIATPTVKIRSKVGAGDSMVAGMVLALARGEPVGRAVRFGVASGAAAVMTPGTELCRREDAERLFESMNGIAR